MREMIGTVKKRVYKDDWKEYERRKKMILDTVFDSSEIQFRLLALLRELNL